jgi:hypothetical protein
MPLGLRPLIIIAAGIACLILAFVVLIGHPHNEIDLLAWIGVAAGVGLVLTVAPVDQRA